MSSEILRRRDGSKERSDGAGVAISKDNIRGIIDGYKAHSVERLREMIAGMEILEEYETCNVIKCALEELIQGYEYTIIIK